MQPAVCINTASASFPRTKVPAEVLNGSGDAKLSCLSIGDTLQLRLALVLMQMQPTPARATTGAARGASVVHLELVGGGDGSNFAAPTPASLDGRAVGVSGVGGGERFIPTLKLAAVNTQDSGDGAADVPASLTAVADG